MKLNVTPETLALGLPAKWWAFHTSNGVLKVPPGALLIVAVDILGTRIHLIFNSEDAALMAAEFALRGFADGETLRARTAEVLRHALP